MCVPPSYKKNSMCPPPCVPAAMCVWSMMMLSLSLLAPLRYYKPLKTSPKDVWVLHVLCVPRCPFGVTLWCVSVPPMGPSFRVAVSSGPSSRVWVPACPSPVSVCACPCVCPLRHTGSPSLLKHPPRSTSSSANHTTTNPPPSKLTHLTIRRHPPTLQGPPRRVKKIQQRGCAVGAPCLPQKRNRRGRDVLPSGPRSLCPSCPGASSLYGPPVRVLPLWLSPLSVRLCHVSHAWSLLCPFCSMGPWVLPCCSL